MQGFLGRSWRLPRTELSPFWKAPGNRSSISLPCLMWLEIHVLQCEGHHAPDWWTHFSFLNTNETTELTNQIERVHDTVDLFCRHFYFEKHQPTFGIKLTVSFSLLDEPIQSSFLFSSHLLLRYQQIMTAYGGLVSEITELGPQHFSFQSSGWAYRIIIVCKETSRKTVLWRIPVKYCT